MSRQALGPLLLVTWHLLVPDVGIMARLMFSCTAMSRIPKALCTGADLVTKAASSKCPCSQQIEALCLL